MQYAAVIAIVAAALFFMGRHMVRQWKGKSNTCSCGGATGKKNGTMCDTCEGCKLRTSCKSYKP